MLRQEGLTWKQLSIKNEFHSEAADGKEIHHVFYFPKKTLARLLKALIRMGVVEWFYEPRVKGQRGRQSKRYKVSSKIVHRIYNGVYTFGIRFPHQEVRGMPFRGTYVKRYRKSKQNIVLSENGKTSQKEVRYEPIVRLWPEEKKRKERFEAWLKEIDKRRSRYEENR